MVDYAFLSGLAGKRDWNAIRAEKRAETDYLSAINQLKEQQVEKQAMLQNELAKYLSTIDDLQLTPIGKDRINEQVNLPMKEAIANEIKKYGGDLETYMKVRGATDMNNYIKTLVSHPLTQKELGNAADIAKWKADKEAGLWERRDFDPTTGQLGPQFSERLDRYLNGEIDQLGYKGAFKPKGFDEKFFGQVYGSENRYKSVPVSVKDYATTSYRHLIESGQSEEDAAQESFVLAKQYESNLQNGGVPLRYKSDAWKPSAGWENAQSDKEAVKYIAERTGKLLAKDMSNIWDEINIEMPDLAWKPYDPKTGGWMQPSSRGAKISKRSSALNGTYLGDYTQKILRKNPTTGLDEEYFSPVKNQVTDVVEQDGKVYIQTAQAKYEDELNNSPSGGYREFTDNTIDQLVLGAKDPRKAASSLRKALKEMGVYENGIVNFGDKKGLSVPSIPIPKTQQQPQPQGNNYAIAIGAKSYPITKEAAAYKLSKDGKTATIKFQDGTTAQITL